MNKNKLVIAAAGSGKTTFLVNEALKTINGRIIITTYTQANEEEIRKKIIKVNQCIPENITIKTWFSFLLQHGVRPYQGKIYDKKINGLIQVNSQSAVKYINKSGIPICYKEDEDFEKHYFNSERKIYSDKLSKFVVKCNKINNGAVIERLARIFSHIFIDEVQDLAGYDLEFLKLIFKSSSNVFLVGDPRQVTYLTHNEKKYNKYTNGLIKDFILNECKNISYKIDEDTLNTSYRCNAKICMISSKLYPSFKTCISNQNEITGHDGIFLVKKIEIENYLFKYNPVQLRLNKTTKDINLNYNYLNFGESKGLEFDRVLIYPTNDMIKWIINNNHNLADKTRAQFYVALTRARHSVGIVWDYDENTNIDNINKF